jgi:hypothetical protein
MSEASRSSNDVALLLFMTLALVVMLASSGSLDLHKSAGGRAALDPRRRAF